MTTQPMPRRRVTGTNPARRMAASIAPFGKTYTRKADRRRRKTTFTAAIATRIHHESLGYTAP